MYYLADRLFYENISIYALAAFVAIGFAAGFFFRVNSRGRKNKLKKMENEAAANQARIAALRQKLETLEKENKGKASQQ